MEKNSVNGPPEIKTDMLCKPMEDTTQWFIQGYNSSGSSLVYQHLSNSKNGDSLRQDQAGGRAGGDAH